MEISRRLKERFCKDTKVPINIYEEPYFLDRVELTDKLYDTKRLLKRFADSLKAYESEEEFFDDYNATKDKVIEFIKSRPGYKEFHTVDMKKYSDFIHDTFKTVPENSLGTIYTGERYKGLHFSIDIRKANFSCIRKFDPNIFDGATSYQEFISRFTDNEYIIESKAIREIIFGNCFSKRLSTYERYLISVFYAEFAKTFSKLIEDKLIYLEYVNNDEVIFGISDSALDQAQTIQKMIDFVDNYEDIPLKPELFYLTYISDAEDDSNIGFIKNIFTENSSTYDFKCIDSYNMPFVLRKFQDEEYIESDAIFVHQKKLAKFFIMPKFKFVDGFIGMKP